MKYKNIKQAVFLSRPNRFIARVQVDGLEELVHVKNTGRCKELLVPGCEVWLTDPGTPGRKTKYDLIAVRKGTGVLFNVDSQAANQAAKEWLMTRGYDVVLPEHAYGESRIDFYMEKARKGKAFEGKESEEIIDRYLLEIKGCTLEVDGIGYFPDAPTERGVKHMRELIKAQKEGYHAALGFVIQMDGVREVRPNVETQPEFGKVMEEARAAGVKILFFICHVEPDGFVITEEIEG